MSEQINKDATWLKMCQAGGQIMAKCSKAQYFSYIIDKHGRVRGCGYNGTPAGMDNCIDGGCPRATSGVPSGTPYNIGAGACFGIHAEMNALVGIDRAILVESTIYVNGICCFGCAKEITGAGIKRVVNLDADVLPQDYELTKSVFEKCGVEWVRIKV
jgi:dCMP deaminase